MVALSRHITTDPGDVVILVGDAATRLEEGEEALEVDFEEILEEVTGEDLQEDEADTHREGVLEGGMREVDRFEGEEHHIIIQEKWR